MTVPSTKMCVKLGLIGFTFTILGMGVIGGLFGVIGFAVIAGDTPEPDMNWTGELISALAMIPGLSAWIGWLYGKEKKWF